MDAALGWEIIGSLAAVVAIPAGLVMGAVQLRSSRRGTQEPGRRHDVEATRAGSAGDHNAELQPGSLTAIAENHEDAFSADSALAHMRTIVKYRDWEQLQTLAISNPSAAVLGTWRTLTFIIYKVAYAQKYLATEDWSTELPLIARRMGADWLTSAAIEDMRQMRDRTERGDIILRSDALEYVDAAETVLDAWLGQAGSLSGEHRAR